MTRTEQVLQKAQLVGRVKQGEKYLNGVVKANLDTFNKTNGTIFKSINDMGIYANDMNYSKQAECKAMISWNNLFWDTARANQASVLDGTMTDEEFIALLPVIPVV